MFVSFGNCHARDGTVFEAAKLWCNSFAWPGGCCGRCRGLLRALQEQAGGSSRKSITPGSLSGGLHHQSVPPPLHNSQGLAAPERSSAQLPHKLSVAVHGACGWTLPTTGRRLLRGL
eukprot:11212364-Lingulodinium_polyedra.AAC.1